MKYLLLFLSIFLLSPGIASAQIIQQNALSVTPSFLQLDLATDQPEATLTYANTSNQTLIVNLSASDFAPLEDGYKLSFLSQKDANNYKYSLSSWIDFSEKAITLPPKSTKNVTLFIQKSKLTPGGHYATILAQVIGDQNNSVQLNGILASLLFVRTNTGIEKDEGHIVSSAVDQDTFSFPTSISFRLNNTGDTTLTPYGIITITDMLNRTVSKGIVNRDSLETLPESIRQYTSSLRSLSPALLPGTYTVHIMIHFGKKVVYQTQNFTFLSQGQVPYAQIILIGGFAGLLFLFIKKRLPRKSSEDI